VNSFPSETSPSMSLFERETDITGEFEALSKLLYQHEVWPLHAACVSHMDLQLEKLTTRVSNLLL